MKEHLPKLNNQKGFTLIETLLSLVIFSIVFLIIGMTLQAMEHNGDNSFMSDFYLALNLIEDRGYKVSDYSPHRLFLKKNNRVYNLKLEGNKLVMSTNKGGYSLLLDNVKSIDWNYHEGILTTRVENNNGYQISGKSCLNAP